MSYRACVVCGAPFVARDRRHRHCPAHEQHGREHSSPTTLAQDAEYHRNRRAILASHPPCHWCGAPATTIDHLKPVARGGTNHRSNLVAACEPCNKSKQARDTPGRAQPPAAASQEPRAGAPIRVRNPSGPVRLSRIG